MSEPKFRPRDYVGEGEFGKVQNPASVAWRIPRGGTREFLLAAAIQHVHSLTVRRAVKAGAGGYTSLRHLCEGKPRDLPYELVLGMLRGDDILRVEVIGLLVFYLGVAAVPGPTEIEGTIAAVVKAEVARISNGRKPNQKAIDLLAARKLHR